MMRPTAWREPRPALVAHYRAGPECSRSGCHRTALVRTIGLGWRLCGPCLDAVTLGPRRHLGGSTRVEVL